MVTLAPTVRPAQPADQTQLANLLHFEPFVHRHLDWRAPLDWVGASDFWVLEARERVMGALACPPDPQGIHWLRVFACGASLPLRTCWQTLWGNARDHLSAGAQEVAVLVMNDWLPPLLLESGFQPLVDIASLEWEAATGAPQPTLPPNVHLRPMQVTDLPEVADLDAAAFAPLWRNSLPSLRLAFPQAGYATVLEDETGVIGYQLSTLGGFGVQMHLARLAVHPRVQGRGMGRILVQDLLQDALRKDLRRVTVNTQNSNQASLHLYEACGFRRTIETYPVYLYFIKDVEV